MTIKEGKLHHKTVSVIIPTFNRRPWIGECLDSILAQAYPYIEVVVVDDCSTDDTVEWIRGQPRFEGVKLHVQEKNGGASIARNTGIGISSGDLIVFIDSDDLLMPNHVETAVCHFERYPDIGLFCCDSTMIDQSGGVILDGKTWHQNLAEIKRLDIKTGFRTLRDVFLYSNCFPGFTLRREVFELLGGFDQSIFPADDYDLALRVAGSDFKVYYLHEALCLRREHDGQCSGIQNSVATCKKLGEALVRTTNRYPSIANSRKLVRKRLAEVDFETGISQLKEGDRLRGAGRVASSMLNRPEQIGNALRIGGRMASSTARSRLKSFAKLVYSVAPFKPQAFRLLRRFASPTERITRHLHFHGDFDVIVDQGCSFRIRHYGFEIENTLFWSGFDGCWESFALRNWVELAKKSHVILDIGANTGIYSLSAKAVNRDARVIAIEPIARVFDKLVINNQLNGFDIECLRLAASNVDGTAEIWEMRGDNPYSSTFHNDIFKAQDAMPVIVDVRTLDSLIRERHIDHIDLVKIDVEGHEHEVLQGFLEHLGNFRPKILIEVLTDDVGSAIEILIGHLGYHRLFLNETTKTLDSVDTLTRRRTYNYLLTTDPDSFVRA